MIRQRICILPFFSGECVLGGWCVFSCCFYVWGTCFAFSVGNTQYFQSAQVTSAARKLYRPYRTIRHSSVSFYIFLSMSVPAHHHHETKKQKTKNPTQTNTRINQAVLAWWLWLWKEIMLLKATCKCHIHLGSGLKTTTFWCSQESSAPVLCLLQGGDRGRNLQNVLEIAVSLQYLYAIFPWYVICVWLYVYISACACTHALVVV